MNNYILYAILILTGLLGTYAIIPLFRSLLIESNVLRPNYKKDMIPVSMGIVFLPMLIINAIILAYFTTNFKDMLHIFIFLFGLVSMFFAGILDDIIGNRDVSGLKGHFKSLLNGKLTTGGFKALFGGFVGLVVPHMMRMLVGPDHRVLLPASALAGAAFLVVCDSLGRIIIPPAEVRVGIMTALLGTPYFLYLLRRMQKQVF